MRTLADDRGCTAGVRRGDVSDRPTGRADLKPTDRAQAAKGLVAESVVAAPAISRTTKIAGGLGLAAIFGLVLLGVIGLSGFNAATMSGVYTGAFFGLISLVVEMAVIGRSLRLFEHNGMQATLQTFIMRLVTVAGIGMWFMRAGSQTDGQAFCLSYLATFFVYMCWLTWRTYHQPVQYQGTRAKAARVAARAARRSAELQVAKLQVVGAAR